MRVIGGHHPLGSKCTHVQPDRGRSRSAIEYKRDRPWLGFRTVALAVRLLGLEVGGVEHARLGTGLLVLVLRRVLGNVVPVPGGEDKVPDVAIVVDSMTIDRQGTSRVNPLGREVLRWLGLLLLICIGFVRGMQHGNRSEQQYEPPREAANASYVHRSLPKICSNAPILHSS